MITTRPYHEYITKKAWYMTCKSSENEGHADIVKKLSRVLTVRKLPPIISFARCKRRIKFYLYKLDIQI